MKEDSWLWGPAQTCGERERNTFLCLTLIVSVNLSLHKQKCSSLNANLFIDSRFFSWQSHSDSATLQIPPDVWEMSVFGLLYYSFYYVLIVNKKSTDPVVFQSGHPVKWAISHELFHSMLIFSPDPHWQTLFSSLFFTSNPY